MFHRFIAKKNNLRVVSMSAVTLCLIGFFYTWHFGSSAGEAHSALTLDAKNKSGSSNYQQVASTVITFAAPELGILINSAQIKQDNGAVSVNCLLTNIGGEDLEEVEMMLLNFDGANRIDSIAGDKFKLLLHPALTQQLSFFAERTFNTSHTQILTIRSIRKASMAKELDRFDLLQKLIALKTKGITPTLAATTLNRQQEFIDTNFCHTIFRLAHNLANSQQAILAGYTCANGRGAFMTNFSR